MTTHIHEVTKFGYMGNEAGTAKITLPGPSWEAPAQREHQRPAPEAVRLTKSVPRGLVTPKPEAKPKHMPEDEYGEKLLRASVAGPETPEQRAAILSFWHRTRKVFVPLTASELKARSGIVSSDLVGLSVRKLIVCTTSGPNNTEGSGIYEITPNGKSWVMAYWASQSVIKVSRGNGGA
jgi:hypothetical protein